MKIQALIGEEEVTFSFTMSCTDLQASPASDAFMARTAHNR